MSARRTPPRAGETLALIVLLGVGAVARVAHSTASGLWRDEALALDIATLPTVGALIEFLVRHESHPPLFYLLLRGWTTIAGSSDAAVVLPGILVGLVTIAAVWWLVRSVASPATAMAAAGFVALNPSMIQADATARPYALLQLLLVVAAGCLWTALSRASRSALFGWVLAAVALLYIHNWTALPVVAMAVMALWFISRGHSRLPPTALVTACVVIALTWLPWWPSLWYQIQHGGHLAPRNSPLLLLPVQLALGVPGLRDKQGIVVWAGMAAVLVLRRRALSGTRPGLVVLLVGTVVTAMLLATVGSFKTNLLIAHTVPMLAPLLLVAAAVFLTDPEPRGRLLAWFATGLVLALSAFGSAQLAVTPRSNAQLITQYLHGHTRPEDLVLVVPVYVASSIRRYYRGPAPLAGYPDGTVKSPLEFNDRVRRDTMPEVLQAVPGLARRTLEGGGRVWVISYEAPEHLKAPWHRLELELERIAGPPTWIVAARREATMEHLDLRMFSGPSRPPGR